MGDRDSSFLFTTRFRYFLKMQLISTSSPVNLFAIRKRCKIQNCSRDEVELILSRRRVRESRLGKLYEKKQRTSYSDTKGVTHQAHLTEKLMNKLQNLYGIVLEQSVAQTIHQLKVLLLLAHGFIQALLLISVF